MPSRYPVEVRKQVGELARSGTRVAQLAETFGMSEAVIYGWLKQERIDRGEAPGLSTEGQMELAAAKRRIGQLETNWRSPGRSTRCSLSRTCPQKPLPGDRFPDRAGVRRAASLPDARRVRLWLLRLEAAPAVRSNAEACVACR